MQESLKQKYADHEGAAASKTKREIEENTGHYGAGRPANRAYSSSSSEAGNESKNEDKSSPKSQLKRSNLERQQEEAKRERDQIRAQRRREIIREDRMERAGLKKSKTERDQDRDISEKIALGQAQPTSREAMFDQRLFNQTAGLESGFGHDEDYNLYDKPLFADRTAASIYKNINKNADEEAETDDQKT